MKKSRKPTRSSNHLLSPVAKSPFVPKRSRSGGNGLASRRSPSGATIVPKTGYKVCSGAAAFYAAQKSRPETERTLMADAEPKLLLPILRPFYDAVVPLSWLIVRVAVGWNLLVHGWGKIMAGPTEAYLKGFSDIGFIPAAPWFWRGLVIEPAGGIALILGLFTRFFAAAVAIEMLIITLVYWKTGFAWTRRGYEYTLMWGLISFAIALRGGGPYSLDRKLGREL